MLVCATYTTIKVELNKYLSRSQKKVRTIEEREERKDDE